MSNERITEKNDSCGRAHLLQDYAVDELAASERPAFEQHLASCDDCAGELDRLRLTTATLRILPDVEIPQRIAFVSDPVMGPSRWAWITDFWNSGARLGFASACVLAIAIVIAAYHRPAAAPANMAQTAIPASTEISKQVNVAVASAVAEAIGRVRTEDARAMQTAMELAERKQDHEHQALMVAMEENLTVLQKRLGTYTILASADATRTGASQ